MHASRFVLTYDLLDDRLVESFENVENILPDWANEDVEKS